LNRETNDLDQHFNEPFTYMFPGGSNVYYSAGSTGYANCAALVATYGPQYGDPAGSYCTGTYGYATIEDYGSLGKVTSMNHGFFFQDAWTIGKGITINAGVRI